jgi:NAD(P)H-dependent FMN reductase
MGLIIIYRTDPYRCCIKQHTEKCIQFIGNLGSFVISFPQSNRTYPTILKTTTGCLYNECTGWPSAIVHYVGHGKFQATLAMNSVTQGLRMHNMSTNLPLDIEKEMFDQPDNLKILNRRLSDTRIHIKRRVKSLQTYLENDSALLN